MDKNDKIIIKCKGGGSIISKPPIFSPNGQCLYIPWRNVVRSFNVVTGERVTDYDGCADIIIKAQINPNNPELLMACSDKGAILCWRLETEFLVSKRNIDCEIDEILTFHVLLLRDYPKADDCEILLSWVYRNIYYIGLFTSRDCKLLTKIPMKMKTNTYWLDVGGSAGNQFMALVEDNKLQWYDFNKPEKIYKYKIGKSRTFTCVACHPEEACIATGDSSGQILIWRNIYNGANPLRSVYHWHTLPVKTIVFSHAGTDFYSGAGECVVVKWHMENPQRKNFLPRLPAPIQYVVIAPENLHLAIASQDNGIQVVDTHFKLKCVVQHLVWGVPFPAGLHVDNRTRSIILNGRLGHLQFYSPQNMSLLYNLDIVGQNQITQERDVNIPNTNVIKTALSKGSDWLATVEERRDEGKIQELRLKFWQYDNTNQTFTLNTSVELPHENGVREIEFQPVASATELLCITVGSDDSFKIWNLEDTTTIYRQSKNWCCGFVGYYKHLPATAMSFSTDGSVLAVAFDCCLTLWSPDVCQLTTSLVHPSYKDALRLVQFGNVDQSHLIVTASAKHIMVWNLLTLSLVWTVAAQLAILCADPCSPYMVAITETDHLFVFQPNSTSVVFTKTDMCSRNETILAATFVPHGVDSTTGVPWQRHSRFYYVNSKQELLCLETKGEQASDVQLELMCQLERSAFSAMLAENITSDVKDGEAVIHMDRGLRRSMTVQELIVPPVHTMAPMRLLCCPLLRSFVLKPMNSDRAMNASCTRFASRTTYASRTRYASRAKNYLYEPMESDDETPRQRTQMKPEVKENAEEIPDTTDLHYVLEEPTNWTSTIL